MSKKSSEAIQCPQCGNSQDVTIWSSLNVGQDPDLRKKLFQGEINKFVCDSCQKQASLDAPLMYHDMSNNFAVQYYPSEYIDNQEFVKLFEPTNPPKMKGLPENMSCVGQPHIVFEVDDFLNCIVFHEKIRGVNNI